MIGHKRIEGCEGGIEKTVRDLSHKMAERGHCVTVYDRKVLFSGACNSKAGSQDNIKVVRIPTLPGAAEVPLYSFLAALHAALSGCGAVMFHASGPCRMIPVARLFGKKTIAFIHGLDSNSSKWGRYASHYLRMGERRAARSADALLLLSNHISEHFRKTYGRAGTLVFNGVAPPGSGEGDGAVLEKEGLREKGYILWVGRISREKQVGDLIKAHRMSGSCRTLYLAGDTESTNRYYRELAAYCAENEGPAPVIFGGRKNASELEALYRNAFAFVLPSQQEGMPHALLEAASCGTPCILSDIPECRAVAGDHALYARSGDVEELCAAIKQLETDPQLPEKLTEGQAEEILSRFSLDASADRIIGICRRVIDGEHV